MRTRQRRDGAASGTGAEMATAHRAGPGGSAPCGGRTTHGPRAHRQPWTRQTPHRPLVLHHSPHACSQTAVCALKQAGLTYRLNLIDLSVGAQSTPSYLALSPPGKVPALEAEGAVITENAAILTYIAALAPDAGLFPEARTALALSERQAGLSFCGGTLHPTVRGLAAPQRLTDGDVAALRSRATALAAKALAVADRLLAERGWWLTEESIIDVYLNWAVQTARRGGFDLSAFPMLASLPDRLMARASFAAMTRIEQEAAAILETRRVAGPA